ncbi:hypothetical protein SynROS8604_03231 [Synechococcus sp. ROS8604]|nr:hypothetical protein SynROS8604_03231 [Synechococcus sp. ROS8604]
MPRHKPVSLYFNQQRHHPLRLNFTRYIPSKLFNAKRKPRLVPSALLALSANKKPRSWRNCNVCSCQPYFS